MIPILMLSIPPVAAGGGYACWSFGEYSVLKWKQVTHPPPQTLATFFAGTTSFICSYGLQSMMFLNDNNKTKKNDMAFTKDKTASKLLKSRIPVHKQSSTLHYQPPKSFEEVFHHIGRPLITRLAAGGVSFFCAGIVQTLVLTV
jgi:hypothetical protein